MGLSAAAGGRGHGVWDSPRPGSEAWPGQVLKGDLSARGLGFSAQGWGAPGVTRGHEDNTQSRSPNTSAHTALPFKTSGTQKTGLGKKPEDRCSQPHPPAPGTLTEFASPSFYLQTPRTSSSKPRKTPRTNLAGRPSVSKSSAGGDKQSLPHTSDRRPLPPQHWNRVARATRPTASPFATFADEVTAATGSGSQQPCVNQPRRLPTGGPRARDSRSSPRAPHPCKGPMPLRLTRGRGTKSSGWCESETKWRPESVSVFPAPQGYSVTPETFGQHPPRARRRKSDRGTPGRRAVTVSQEPRYPDNVLRAPE